MSQYRSVSIDNVIAKILRDTRVVDSSYISDFHEWIPEAMALMNTKAPLVPQVASVKINFHIGKLPCGLIHIEAIEYQGRRLRYHNGVRKLGSYTASTTSEDAPFETKVISRETVNGNMVIDTDLVPPATEHPTAGYQIYLDHIATTFPDGVVKVYFKSMAMDSRGLPLIPDHQDYKEALYWFVRTKMIQSGFEDPMYRNDDRAAYERWEKHAARAISDIHYPTPDEKEAQLAMHVRFIPPVDYYESFFNSTQGEGALGL